VPLIDSPFLDGVRFGSIADLTASVKDSRPSGFRIRKELVSCPSKDRQLPELAADTGCDVPPLIAAGKSTKSYLEGYDPSSGASGGNFEFAPKG